MPGVLCLPYAVGSANVLERHWQLGAPLSGPFSASVSLSVVLAHTQESNFRSGNEKSPSRVIWLQCGLNNAVFQCWERVRAVCRAVPEQRKEAVTIARSAEEGTQELKKSSPSLPWQHTPGPASHLGKSSLTCVLVQIAGVLGRD